MRNLCLLGVLCLSLTGCATKLANPTFYEKVPLNLPEPGSVVLAPVNFYVITKENFEQVIAEIEASGGEPVVIAITEEDYKALERNLEQIQGKFVEWRHYGQEYRKYYEPPNKEPK